MARSLDAMLSFFALLTHLLLFITPSHALRWSADQVGWNLNENATASDPLDYWGEWAGHDYNPSPKNWRFPFYMLTIDRYVDGDPTNNDANGTVFENDWMTNQFRFGGDARGLMNHLDYIQGLGIKAIYLSGSPFINQPWASDGFGPLDFTLLDHHHGMIEDWRALVDEMHERGMYIILDNTVGTMGDLLAFQGWENATTPFNPNEYDVLWKTDRQYHDFLVSNTVNESCQYPVFWDDNGYPYEASLMDQFNGCRESDFDQYGDMKGVGYVPPYQTQLSKFASVQDRLRLWKRDVLDKVMHFSCMQIAMLDIDGFRVDKALQTPLSELAEWSTYQRECARRYGKENFLIVGEAVGELNFSSTFYGRGKSPDMYYTNVTEAQLATNDSAHYIRDTGNNALDGAAFHYPTYGAMTRFLGLDGEIGFEGVDFADHWNKYLMSDDMVNGLTGEFDPRHMFGMTNQDVFRWPSLANGTQRQSLGFLITMLELPGIPMIMWGEEQEYKVLENLAADYIFGRQPMASTRAWQLHGCYKVGAAGNGYYDMPFDSALEACHDDDVSLDQRDPSHPVRNLLKRMFELRSIYPVLNDGYTVQTLFYSTFNIFLPHSGLLPTPQGIWSVYRGRTPGVQDFAGDNQGNQGVWLMYQNQNKTVNYSFDCSNATGSLVAPFPAGSTVKNLFYPYEEYTLDSSTTKLGIEQSNETNGCLPSIELEAWGWKAFVPVDRFVPPAPVITKVTPRHDARISTSMALDEFMEVPVELQFSREMDCDSITRAITTNSTTSTGISPKLNVSAVVCQNMTAEPTRFVGQIGSTFSWRATFLNVSHGVHTFTVNNATSSDGLNSTSSRDRFMFRIGSTDNPMVFPVSANYTANLLEQDAVTGKISFQPKAVGADMWRYSTNWGTTYSNWTPYAGQQSEIEQQAWSGTTEQEWNGVHIITQYWSDITGSTDHIQHSDLDSSAAQRWPHVHVQGVWNQFGYDGGLVDTMQLKNGQWIFDLPSEWPTSVILNVWGMNPDGAPDKSAAYGDVDGDGVLDWVPPDSLAFNEINITDSPAYPYIAHRIIANDGDFSYTIEPVGSAGRQIAVYILLALTSITCAFIAAGAFVRSFYGLKFNTVGLTAKNYPFDRYEKKGISSLLPTFINRKKEVEIIDGERPSNILANTAQNAKDRTVLIATMEYEIEDWAIKIKIGGLGVMASLMGKNLGHQNLIWVVPCVGDVEYPTDTVAEPMTVFIMGKPYEIMVQYHVVRNITYVLLDAPVFRQQTKAEPYPARMDDMDSAIYYSAWNACIAETMKRFPEIDLYHINDYHGAVAPLHLLPQVIPCCLSLHNAEFQGLWSINTPERLQEISDVFNLDKKIVKKYVQWGEVFNLLHAGASYLRIHQKGFGAAGVSKKYGKRSFARYPIFWGLQKVGALPNPDPSDTGDWDKKLPDPNVSVDTDYESKRGELRKQAQEWAGLTVDEKAELFVFVGRWSMQKGIDLIADVFPTILKEKPNTQLICVGPVIDLYGKFAALKLSRLMEMYPGRVFSKPEFTALPPFIFSGAEFALIPSRDEPFGLVAVEFGRKGALGVGARVGGLGQMPGWWFTIESVTTQHMLTQFKSAIKGALTSDQKTRALMRARSGVQRFPVAQWVEDLELLQSTSIKISGKVQKGLPAGHISVHGSALQSPANTAPTSPSASIPGTAPTTAPGSQAGSRVGSRAQSRSGSPTRGQGETSSRIHSAILARRLASLRKTNNRASLDQMTTGDLEAGNNLYPIASHDPEHQLDIVDEDENNHDLDPTLPSSPASPVDSTLPSGVVTPAMRYPAVYQSQPATRPGSTLSVNEVVGDHRDYKLQTVDPSFTDSTGTYYKMFDQMLMDLNPKNSEGKLCIEEFLHRSEKNWFGRFHEAKLGKSQPSSAASSLYGKSWLRSHNQDEATGEDSSSGSSADTRGADNDPSQFMLNEKYEPPTGVAKVLQLKIGDWPVYSFLLALGQIIAANSYQITLITGAVGETATKLYVVASVYLAGSVFWWVLFRCVASRWVLSMAFLAYGLAFFLLGLAPYGSSIDGRGWIQNVATAVYALASASGSLFFALNFGSEGGTPVRSWIFRACTIQGTQQIYVTVLWYWGSYLTSASAAGVQSTDMFTYTPGITAVTTPIAVLLWAVGAALFVGLPDYYRATPGSVPSFYRSLAKRRIVLWFFAAVLLQNYWLSAPYGRSWRYLWSSEIVPAWAIAVLVVFFFVGVWSGMLWALARLSIQHSWFLPIFAIGLGAPRWGQMLWGISGIGAYLPWGSAAGGAIAGRALWLWLGVLDALQGVGFGMILLQTLTRFHIAFTLMAAQVLGSIATIAARASAPDNVGPGTVFPNFGLSLDGVGFPWFWICLGCQLLIPVGFFIFFRKEQLFKP